ncbi:40S ribosomal protein SA-like [Equus quagga]|uniref:40S ribosomal protein SA-like n=1 Tax=Equus quagga TaxID=89248 RepID=UPI001EE39950|nr:40S ribosomal protein SA-like [Equus quagga]
MITDPRADHESLTKVSYVNLQTTRLCNTDCPLHSVNIVIPCNNKGAHSLGLVWGTLAQGILHMRSTISCKHPWHVMPDLYFSRDAEDIKKEDQATIEKAMTKDDFQGEWIAPAPELTATQLKVPSLPIQQFPTED